MSGKIRRGGGASKKSVVLGSAYQPPHARTPAGVKKVQLKNRKAQDKYRSSQAEDFQARQSGEFILF
jgi:hypothetical protein